MTRPITSQSFEELAPAGLIDSKIESKLGDPGNLRRKKRHLRRRLEFIL